jgi:hypothetical protein
MVGEISSDAGYSVETDGSACDWHIVVIPICKKLKG